MWYTFIHSSISKLDQSYIVVGWTRRIRSLKKSAASYFSTWILHTRTFLDLSLHSHLHCRSNNTSTGQSTVTSFFSIANCWYTSVSLHTNTCMSNSFYLKKYYFQIPTKSGKFIVLDITFRSLELYAYIRRSSFQAKRQKRFHTAFFY